MNPLLFLTFMVPGTVFLGLNDALIKRLLLTGINSQFLLAVNFIAVGVIGLSPAAVLGMPALKPGFLSAFAATVCINIVAQLCFYRAFERGEASFVSAMGVGSPPPGGVQ